MNMKKAVFLDLDGTLWDHEVIPDSAIKAIEKARENGHKVFINTGRPRFAIPAFLWDMDLDGYCLATGMETYVKGEGIKTFCMDPKKVRRIEKYLADRGCGYALVTSDGCFDDPGMALRRQVYTQKTGREFKFPHVSLLEMQPEEYHRIVKLNFDSKQAPDLETLAKEENLDILYYDSNPASEEDAGVRGELSDAMRTKAMAMEEIAQQLGNGYEIMAIGDSENDISMLKAAKYSICMGNGTPAAKAAAMDITDAIDQDGLYKAFEKYGLLDA